MKRERKQTENFETVHTHASNFNKNGITLIALVVTIVVLLILAGISLNLVLGNNGIVTKANLAVVKQENATVAEAMQFKVNYYNMESIEDIKIALQNDGIMDANGIVDTYTLLEQKLKTGNGSNKKDVYVIEDGHLYYYDKNEEKTDLGNLWNLKTADLEETDPSLFEVDDKGNLLLKDYEDYYSHLSMAPKTWTLENLIIPKTVDGKEVKKISFAKGNTIRGWENIKTIVIPEGVTEIGDNAFFGCINLTTITIPSTVSSIGFGAFAYCSGLTSIIVDENNPFFDSRNNCNAIISKDGTGLISGCKNTTIPNSVTDICDYAFSGCTGLTNIKIGENITYIGRFAFAECSNVASIIVDENNQKYDSRDNCNAIIDKEYNWLITGCKNTIIPNGVTNIMESAFSRCIELKSITIPNTVTSIQEGAFANCLELENITLSDSITYIGEHVFSGCTRLNSITIPNSVTRIEKYAFSGCLELKDIIMSNNVTYIGDSAFEDCSKLANVIFPDSLSTICENAFYNCHSLLNIVIPKNVAEINIGAFAACTNLTNIMVDESNTIYDSRDNCNAIIEKAKNELIVGCQNTIIPNSITSIGTRAFWKCTQLTKMIVPESVTNIDWLAFEDCIGLTNITIPENVTSMRGDVFYGWTSNQTINCEAAAKPDGWDSSWNYGCNAQIKWNAK